MIIIYTNKREQVDVSQQGALFPTKALSFSSKEYLLIPRLERTVSLSPRGCHPPGYGGPCVSLPFFQFMNFCYFLVTHLRWISWLKRARALMSVQYSANLSWGMLEGPACVCTVQKSDFAACWSDTSLSVMLPASHLLSITACPCF